MTTLLDLRKAIKTLLTSGGLWTAEEVIITRRTKIWNTVATAISASKNGQCLVIGTAKGDPQRNNERSKIAIMDLTIVVTIIETARPDPEDEEDAEDERWQQTVALLQGDTLGRSEDHDNTLRFDGFDEVPSETYAIRQTLFKTRFLVSAKNTPQPEPPEEP
jgi:hypothetical protein